MKNFYKICTGLLVWLLIATLNISSARLTIWEREPSKPVVNEPKWSGDVINGNIDGWSNGLANILQWILQFPERTDYTTPLWYALRLVQVSINWILWILSTVALVYMLYCWFIIFSSWTDDKNVQKGKKWISTAAIALAWIWLSWLIVSVMIWFITIVTKVN